MNPARLFSRRISRPPSGLRRHPSRSAAPSGEMSWSQMSWVRYVPRSPRQKGSGIFPTVTPAASWLWKGRRATQNWSNPIDSGRRPLPRRGKEPAGFGVSPALTRRPAFTEEAESRYSAHKRRRPRMALSRSSVSSRSVWSSTFTVSLRRVTLPPNRMGSEAATAGAGVGDGGGDGDGCGEGAVCGSAAVPRPAPASIASNPRPPTSLAAADVK